MFKWKARLAATPTSLHLTARLSYQQHLVLGNSQGKWSGMVIATLFLWSAECRAEDISQMLGKIWAG
jgi:hypothetical protein